MLKKNWTITRRLYATVGLILLLATAGAGCSWWLERQAAATQTQALAQRERLLLTAQRLRFDMLGMSDGLRGLLLEPTSVEEKKRRQAADDDFIVAVEEAGKLLAGRPELLAALNAIGENDKKHLHAAEDHIAALLASKPGEATQYYRTHYLPARRVQDELVNRFVEKVEQFTQRDLGKSELTQFVALGFFVATLLLCLGLARSLVACITQPLAQLIAAAGRLRGGDFTQRIELRRQDEFGQLAEGFNHMTDSLNLLVGQVQRSGIQVNTSATQIAATARQQQSTSIEIAAATTQIGTTSNEISATSRELVKTMNEVNTVATQTAQLADSGRSGLARMDETMRHVMEAASSVNAKLVVLNEKAVNINQVVTTITKVADQTNLLSLNAAIEAEKAGEYGRGFAVVATEIQRLADQTAVAAEDIEQTVREMQAAVTAGVMGMDKFAEEVRQGVGDVQQVSAQLDTVLRHVQGITPQIESVNTTMRTQTENARQISESATKFGDCSRATTAAQQRAWSTVDEFESTARRMRERTARFKLKS